jgi:transcription initiation factor TFIIB
MEGINLDDNSIINLFNEINDIKIEDKKVDFSICQQCNNDTLINDSNLGCFVCSECGYIGVEYFDKNPEYGNFGSDSSSSRLGCTTNFFFPVSSLGTKISGSNFSRVKMLQSWGQMPYNERALMEDLEYIQKISKDYKIPQIVIDNAKILYKKVKDFKEDDEKKIIVRCKNKKSLLAAALYYGAKIQEMPMRPKEIGKIFGLEVKQVNKGTSKFQKMVNLKEVIANIKNSQCTDYIKQYCKKLNLNDEQYKMARQITNNIIKLNLATTHQPTSVTAGAILLMGELTNIQFDKKELAEIFEISDVTITKTFRKILPYREILIDDKITNEIYLAMKKEEKLNLSISDSSESIDSEKVNFD